MLFKQLFNIIGYQNHYQLSSESMLVQILPQVTDFHGI